MSGRKNRTTRWLYSIHKWTGLIVGINLLILSVTAMYILAERMVAESTHDHDHNGVPLIDEARRVPMQPIIDKLMARYDGLPVKVAGVNYALIEEGANTIGFARDEDYFRFHVDPYTGALNPDYGMPPEGTMENGLPDGLVFATAEEGEVIEDLSPVGLWMLELHANLFLGTLGTLLVGIAGLLFFVSTLTGLIIYAPFMKALAFGAIRTGGRFRFALADAHKLIGISSLVFNLFIALTGVGITLGLFAVQFYLLFELREFEASAGEVVVADPLPNFDAVYAAGKSVLPNEHIYNITYPGGIQGDKSFVVYAQPDPYEHPMVPTVAAITAEAAPRSLHFVMPLWIKAILVGAPIHFGSFGGNALRVVYVFFAMSSGLLSVSGFVIWVAKGRAARRRKKAARASAATATPAREPQGQLAASVERGT